MWETVKSILESPPPSGLRTPETLTTARFLYDNLREVNGVLKTLTTGTGKEWEAHIELWPAPVPQKGGGFSVAGIPERSNPRVTLPACTNLILRDVLLKMRGEIKEALIHLGFDPDSA